jgi:isopenicillin-N N-acyltransferase-like protein
MGPRSSPSRNERAAGFASCPCGVHFGPMNLRTLELVGTNPHGWGEQHGEAFRDDIRRLYEIRLGLTLEKTDLVDEQTVLALAEHHLPLLRAFDDALFDEVQGLARGAGLTPAQVVVLNHYTDLRDLRKKDLQALGTQKDPGGCTTLFVDDGHERLLGQTWDMHGSAEPFALLLTVPQDPDVEDTRPTTKKTSAAGVPCAGQTVLFTITGCLGMTGMSSWGLGLTINNLNGVEARVGVVWPAFVRKALRQRTARDAMRLLGQTVVGSGRHYVFADDRDVFGVETSATKTKVIFDGGPGPYVHTNHCIDEEMAPTARILPGSTTVARYETMSRCVAQQAPRTAREMFDGFAAVGLVAKPELPHDVTTCGALVMDLKRRTVLACQGIPSSSVDPLVIEVR